MSRVPLGALLALAAPLAGLVVLLAAPDLDARWEHQPSHFWLVLGAAAVSAALAVSTGTSARRRGDARVWLVSLAFLAAAGFLGLHALATPGVLLDASNLGFAVSTPLGLLLASAFAAASALDLEGRRSLAPLLPLRPVLVGVLVAWAALSLALLPEVADPAVPERGSAGLAAPAALAIVLYAFAVWRYARLWLRRRSGLLLAVAAAWVLLAEAALATAVSRNWHASWWEWHVLMLAAFALVAWAAQREWHEERYTDLYTDETREGTEEVTVLFADLAGFTAFAEERDPAEVTRMLNAYFDAAVPVVQEAGGRVDRLIGDAVMGVFAGEGHPVAAARAAIAFQEAAAAVAREHPEWPRFRVGLNTGQATTGVLGTGGGRTYSVVGDAVNLASRIEGLAPPGAIAVGEETAAALPDAVLQELGEVEVKGREQPARVHLLRSL